MDEFKETLNNVLYIGKKVSEHGCVAWKIVPGKELGALKETLENLVSGKHIQIVTISRPIAYYEYASYSFVDTKEELIDRVRDMCV